MMEEKGLKKYKWLYLWIVGAALAVFSVVMFLNKEFGNSVVFYLTGSLLIIFVIIRFVPLIKTTREKWAIAVNAIEMFVEFVVGLLMIIFTATFKEPEEIMNLNLCYPFLLGGVLYARGVIYLVEISFMHTKPSKLNFFISILLITLASVIIGRFNDFSVDSMRYILILLFATCAIISVVGGITNYNSYRKNYVAAKKQKEAETTEVVEVPGAETEIVIDEKLPENPQNYVS